LGFRLGHPECGGVWYANRYPGCRCDVPSPAYQYSFAPSAEWPKFYSSAHDIKNYYHSFAREHGYLDKYIKLNHEVTEARWQESTGTWLLSITHRAPTGEVQTLTDEVHFLIGNYGILNTWKWPDIPNRESFKGTLVHSANYDPSLDLRDKRVAVIGSGSSSIQIVPEVAKVAETTVLFYRTPQWITSGFTLEGFTDEEGRNFECKVTLLQSWLPRLDLANDIASQSL
jgi:cation diffusion facilitator CzcD-associated flavoprotein CzcO